MTAPKHVRRTQEDRSARTRARLLEATVHSLHARGYAATTTMIVCEDAGVSRGALLHQFPTRIDLMLYVVQAVYEEELRLYHEALDPIADPRERLLAFPKVAWDILGRPAGVAVLEVMQGSRSDAELSARLKPLQAEIEQDSFRQVAAFLGKGGAKASPSATRLLVWAIRGLSIARVLSEAPAETEKSVKLLRRMLAASLDAGVIPAPPGLSRTSRRKRSG